MSLQASSKGPFNTNSFLLCLGAPPGALGVPQQQQRFIQIANFASIAWKGPPLLMAVSCISLFSRYLCFYAASTVFCLLLASLSSSACIFFSLFEPFLRAGHGSHHREDSGGPQRAPPLCGPPKGYLRAPLQAGEP